jgi:adenosylcobyric acid synthase
MPLNSEAPSPSPSTGEGRGGGDVGTHAVQQSRGRTPHLASPTRGEEKSDGLAAARAHVAAVMVQGTGSDVGKSLVVAGLARLFARRGLNVRPFKPQNMSNNAGVTADGGEIGRAQALQAKACLTQPTTDMNPVLLKPQAERQAQLVVQGRAVSTVGARDYHALKPSLLPKVLESFDRLGAQADLLLAEGAGSPAEVNLRDGDIANMGFAEAADVPVVLVADIDRGGVIASIVGTHTLMTPAERTRVRGYIINKFRGDPALFTPALGEIGARTGWPCLGVLPWFVDAAKLPAEDSMSLNARGAEKPRGAGIVTIVVPRLPRISNFDDLDPLAAELNVRLIVVPQGEPLPVDATLILIPGSKATRADLDSLRATGWDIDITAHVRRGGRVLGLCGGYQMLGRVVRDPQGIEGAPGETAGLGLLDVETEIGAAKVLRHVAAMETASGAILHGYEMHMGQTNGVDCARPFATIEGTPDGARSADGLVAGSYLHGLFAADNFRHTWLAQLGVAGSLANYDALVERTLDALAEHLAAHLDIERILQIARSRLEVTRAP